MTAGIAALLVYTIVVPVVIIILAYTALQSRCQCQRCREERRP